MAESLRAETVGNALVANAIQTRIQLLRNARDAAAPQRDPEAISPVSAATQLAAVTACIEHAYAVDAELRPVEVFRRTHAEPLARDRVSVLEPGIADVACRDACETRQLFRRPVRICPDLLDPQPRVITVVTEVDVQTFGDLEVRRSLSDFCFYRLLFSAATGTTW